jgi:NAD(P)-dependent dehydrogenase (short-subunit alcohol dehydrogenase family)
MADGNEPRFVDKVVVVTGGGSGLGAAMCRAFGREGALVAVVDIDGASAERTVNNSGKARAYTCDVSDEAAVAAAFSAVDEDLGPVDVFSEQCRDRTAPTTGRAAGAGRRLGRHDRCAG